MIAILLHPSCRGNFHIQVIQRNILTSCVTRFAKERCQQYPSKLNRAFSKSDAMDAMQRFLAVVFAVAGAASGLPPSCALNDSPKYCFLSSQHVMRAHQNGICKEFLAMGDHAPLCVNGFRRLYGVFWMAGSPLLGCSWIEIEVQPTASVWG